VSGHLQKSLRHCPAPTHAVPQVFCHANINAPAPLTAFEDRIMLFLSG
jgi:hypothetical protein